jgi:hypothetical protein
LTEFPAFSFVFLIYFINLRGSEDDDSLFRVAATIGRAERLIPTAGLTYSIPHVDVSMNNVFDDKALHPLAEVSNKKLMVEEPDNWRINTLFTINHHFHAYRNDRINITRGFREAQYTVLAENSLLEGSLIQLLIDPNPEAQQQFLNHSLWKFE